MPERTETVPCSTCGQPMIWCVTESGKRMPLNASPIHTFVLGEDGIARVVKAYVTHFATCKQADQHRKPREPKGKETARGT